MPNSNLLERCSSQSHTLPYKSKDSSLKLNPSPYKSKDSSSKSNTLRCKSKPLNGSCRSKSLYIDSDLIMGLVPLDCYPSIRTMDWKSSSMASVGV